MTVTVQFEAHPIIPNLNVLPLKALVKELTENREAVEANLNMTRFAKDNEDCSLEAAEVTTECGTVMCLVGRLPLLGFPGLKGESWGTYSERVIGDIPGEVWNYLFSGSWSKDVSDAISRLEDVIEGRPASYVQTDIDLITQCQVLDYNMSIAELTSS